MWKALAYKELRETIGIAVLGLIAFLIATSGCMRFSLDTIPGMRNLFAQERQSIPFVTGSFYTYFTWISAAVAIALGLRQSIGESLSSGYLFLLNRPLNRDRIFAVKLLVGVATYLACAAIPILLFIWWAATEGNHASPFELSMTLPIWQIYLSMPLVYLGAFLAGIRPARWFGSRLVPLITAGSLVSLIQLIPYWWLFGLASLVLLAIALLTNIAFVFQTRDFA